MPEPPDWLSPEARSVWVELQASGAAEGADRDTLTVYCCAVADFNRAQQALDRTGSVIQNARGGVMRSPFAAVKASNAVLIRQLGKELGLTTRSDGEPEPETKTRWRNSAAMERTITALRSGGKIGDADAATTALARHLARALDQVDPGRFPAQTASLARVQLSAIRSLRGLDDEQSGREESLDALLAALSAPLGDPTEP